MLAQFRRISELVLVSTLRLFPSREQRRQMLGILRSVQGPTQVKPHCLASRLYEEDGSNEAILYMEKWDSEPEFNKHVRSDHYLRILAAMELSKTPPELSFHHVSTTQSLDLIERLRGHNGNGSHREPASTDDHPIKHS